MLHLLTIQGFNAKKYHLPLESIGNFKSIVRSVLGRSVFVISNKFKTDIFYESPCNRSNAIIKLWALYLKSNLKPEEVQQIQAYSGDEEALFRYFNSISSFSRNPFLFKLYLKSFQKAFYADPQNTLVNKLITCDQYVVAQHETKGLNAREVLISPYNLHSSYQMAFTKWIQLKSRIKRFEN